MKALEKSIYAHYDVCLAFNKIILSGLESYDGTKKEQLKSFLEDLQRIGCISGMISEFIYHADCKKFYIQHLEDLENIREEIEDSLGEAEKTDTACLTSLLCAGCVSKNTVLTSTEAVLNNSYCLILNQRL